MRFAFVFSLLALPACFPLAVPQTTVRGQILYGSEGHAAALPGAFVRLIESGADRPPRVTTTEANGEYRFDGVPEGSYALFFTTERWVFESNVSRLVEVPVNESRASNPQERDVILDPVTFSPAGALKGKVVAIEQGGQYEGIIINLEGTAFQARAAMDGSFDFGRLPVRAYRATAIGRGVVSDKPVDVVVRAEKESEVIVYIKSSPAPVSAPNRAPELPLGLEFDPLPPAASANPLRLFDSSLLTPNQIVRGTKARFRCAASDPDGDTLVYSWQVSGGTQKPIAQDEIEWSSAAGAASIRCTVTDSQGAFVTATRAVDVLDFRLNGAALANGRVVFSQSDAGVPNYDLVVYDIVTKTAQRLPLPGNEVRPHVYGATAVYSSDISGTADNPSDVYALTATDPVPAEVRLSNTASIEAYDIGPAGIVYANNSGTTCQLLRRMTPAAAPTVIFPTMSAAPEPNAACDRIVVGATTVAFREATRNTVRWRVLVLASGTAFTPPLEWVAGADVHVSYGSGRYVVAIPDEREVVRIDEGDPALTPTLVTTLPELAGTIVATAFGDTQRIVSTAYDTSGLYGTLRATTATTKNIDLDGPRAVLAAGGRYALVGRPATFEVPPSEELELWDIEALP
ncbi:MAG: carboxypeptidase regulatory-like domain-containing protein [Deltaproteobacteria bacterium]|nr:carboxypeptidase regulatory-like domain-containing protein [Deltaproteobacteria bacterium]